VGGPGGDGTGADGVACDGVGCDGTEEEPWGRGIFK
jgi:hypothetical protein